MRLIARSTLVQFWEKHPETKPSLERWIKLVEAARWTSMNDIQASVSSVVVLNAERAKFEIAGGNFRLVVSIAFRPRIVFVKFIGTHKQYDAIDALTVAKY